MKNHVSWMTKRFSLTVKCRSHPWGIQKTRMIIRKIHLEYAPEFSLLCPKLRMLYMQHWFITFRVVFQAENMFQLDQHSSHWQTSCKASTFWFISFSKFSICFFYISTSIESEEILLGRSVIVSQGSKLVR